MVCDLLSVQDFGCRCHGTRRRQRAGCDVTAIRARSVVPLGAIVITAFVLLLTPNTPDLPEVPVATWVPLSAYSGFMLVGTRQGPAVGLRAPPAS